MKNSLICIILALMQALSPISASDSEKPELCRVIVELSAPHGADPTVFAGECAEYVSQLFAYSEYGYIYDTLFCGFELTLPSDSLAALGTLGFISNVYCSAEYEALEYSEDSEAALAAELIGISAAKEAGLTGDCVKVAVIDSGFDVSHPAFDTEVTKTLDLSAYISTTGALRLGALRFVDYPSELSESSKIPFRFDYADGDTDVFDLEPHGTHVAGIIGAAPTEMNDMSGIAPDCQLILMKIFSDGASSASDTALIAALEDAIKLDADVINLSIGQYAGRAEATGVIGLSALIERAEKLGVTIVCAVGNDSVSSEKSILGLSDGMTLPLAKNTDYGTVSSPASSEYSFAAASADNSVIYGEHFRHGVNGELRMSFTDTNQTLGVLNCTFTEYFNNQTLEYAVIPGLGEASDFFGLDLTGKLALVERGVIPFTEKVQNAADSGAIGVIVYANDDEDYINMELTGAPIPAIFINREDGLALISEEIHTVTFDTDFIVLKDSEKSGSISEFSSRGATPSLTLKPDITAVGGGVISTVIGGKYAGASGTSMAAPQLSGACALLIEKFRDAGETDKTAFPERLKQILMNSAVPIADGDGVEVSPRAQGAGLIELDGTLSHELLVTYKENGKAKAELFDGISDSFTVELSLKNLTDSPLSVTLGASLTHDDFTELTYNGVSEYYSTTEAAADRLSVISSDGVTTLNRHADSYSPLTLTLDAGEEREIAIEFTLDKDYHAELNAVFTSGYFVEGFIYCEDENSCVSLPYMGYVGDFGAAPAIDGDIYSGETAVFDHTKLMVKYGGGYLTAGANFFAESDKYDRSAIAFSPNGDGFADSIHLAATSIRNAKGAVFTLTDENGEVIKTTDFGYVTKVKSSEETVYFRFDWDGGDGVYERYRLPDGNYTLTAVYTLDFGNTEQTYTYPIILDTRAPRVTEITLDGDSLTITAEDENKILAIYVYEGGAEDKTEHLSPSGCGVFDVGDFDSDHLYYEVIDCAYNTLVGRISLAEIGE